MSLKKTKINNPVEGVSRSEHTHIIYIRPYDKMEEESIDPSNGIGIVGITSKVDGHAHEVYKRPTGEYFIGDADDGHTHDIENDYLFIDPDKRDSKFDEQKWRDRYKQYMEIAYTSEQTSTDYFEDATECEDMYQGGDNQWPDYILKELKHRPHLSFNIIKSKINHLLGLFATNPVVPKLKDVEASDAGIVDILNSLNTHTFSAGRCDLPHINNEVFLDMLITGRGVFELGIDMSENPDGDPMIGKCEWDQVAFMPHTKKDLKDCEGMVKWRWVTKDYLMMIAPKNLKKAVEDLASDGHIASEYQDFRLISEDKKKFRLMEVTMREYTERQVIYNGTDNYYLNGLNDTSPSWLLDKKVRDEILTIDGFDSVTTRVTQYWVGLIGANMLFSDRLSEFGGYMTIPAYATKRRGYIKGEVKDLIGPQQEKNKRITSYIESLMKLSANGVIYDSETFASPSDAEEYRNKRSIPGYTQEVVSKDNIPIEIESKAPPSELPAVAEMQNREMDLISGFNSQGVGGSGGVSSSVLYDRRRQAVLTSVQYLFDNFNLALREVSKRLIEMYKFYYTPERIYRILEAQDHQLSQDGGPGLLIGGVPFRPMKYNQIKKLWGTQNLQKYDISIDYSGYHATKSEEQLEMFSTLASQGVKGPEMEFLIELNTSLAPSKKERLIEIIRRGSEQAMQAAMQEKNMTINGELQKVAIAQEGQNIRQQKDLKFKAAKLIGDAKIEEEKLDAQRNK